MMGSMADPGVIPGFGAEPILDRAAPALARTGAVIFGEAAQADFKAKFTSNFTSWMVGEQRRIYAICQRLLQDRDEADSATQDVFLKAYQALLREDARAVDDPARWVTRIAVNTCLDRLRSRKWQFWRHHPIPDPEDCLLRATSSRPEAEDRYFAGQIRDRLARALDRLSARQRA